MTGGATEDAVRAALDEAHRAEWARVIAATTWVTRDLDLAEECTQDAYAQALRTWPRTGVPARPGAWLTTVAANRARDVMRREAALRRRLPRLVADEWDPEPVDVDQPDFADDRLRLVFTCCHPALAIESQVALTLRLVCGLTTADVARAFLVQESTMAARITRAKKKIAAARIPYRVPSATDLPRRTDAVVEVIHLVFTTGHAAPSGDVLVRQELVDSAIRMARMLRQLLPDEPSVTAVLALMLLVDARRDTRTSDDGTLLRLSEQDRSRWDDAQIDDGLHLVGEALAAQPPGRFAVEAAIAAVHAESRTWQQTDWAEIVGLYDVLLTLWPSPVVRLNRAAALGYRDGPSAGLRALEPLLDDPALSSTHTSARPAPTSSPARATGRPRRRHTRRPLRLPATMSNMPSCSRDSPMSGPTCTPDPTTVPLPLPLPSPAPSHPRERGVRSRTQCSNSPFASERGVRRPEGVPVSRMPAGPAGCVRGVRRGPTAYGGGRERCRGGVTCAEQHHPTKEPQ